MKVKSKTKKINWKAIRCPRGCGAWWKHEIHIKPGGACAKGYWHHNPHPWAFAPFANKPFATFRVVKGEDGEWKRHPTNPAWKEKGGRPTPVKRCC